MDLLDFSLFILFPLSLFIFVVGTVYRVSKYLFIYRPGVYTVRKKPWGYRLVRLVKVFTEPPLFSIRTRPFEFVGGFLLLHILGLIPLIFLLAQHIAYIEHILPFYSVLWPLAIPISPITGGLTVTSPVGEVKFVESIWGPLTVLLNGDILAVFALAGVSIKITEKIIEKIKGMKHVRVGDVVVWPLLLLILVTGWLATHHVVDNVVSYRFVLGLHIASSAFLIAVMPFTKFFHFLWGFWYGKFHEWYDLVIKRGG